MTGFFCCLASPSLGAFSILRAQVKRLVVLTNSLNDSTPKRGAPLGEQPPRTNFLLRRRRFISEARRENATLLTQPVCGTDLLGNPIYAELSKSEKKRRRGRRVRRSSRRKSRGFGKSRPFRTNAQLLWFRGALTKPEPRRVFGDGRVFGAWAREKFSLELPEGPSLRRIKRGCEGVGEKARRARVRSLSVRKIGRSSEGVRRFRRVVRQGWMFANRPTLRRFARRRERITWRFSGKMGGPFGAEAGAFVLLALRKRSIFYRRLNLPRFFPRRDR